MVACCFSLSVWSPRGKWYRLRLPELEPPFNNGGYLEVKPQRKVTTDHDVNFLLKAPMSSFVMTHGPSRRVCSKSDSWPVGRGSLIFPIFVINPKPKLDWTTKPSILQNLGPQPSP